MEKVKLRREVAETIDRAFRDYASISHIVSNKARGNVFPETYDLLNTLDLDTLIRTLYIGYEVEETPEDKVRSIYKCPIDSWNPNAYKAGIEDTLRALGIKIEGVNA